MSYNTRNPIGSTDPRDLSDNAKCLDSFTNGPEPTYTDRLGANRKSIPGMIAEFDTYQLQRGEAFHSAQTNRESVFDAAQASRRSDFATFMDASGFESPEAYIAGLLLSRITQTVSYLGNEYRVKSQFLPLTTTTWATDESKLKLVGDDSLRQEMALAGGSQKVGWSRTILSETIKTVGEMLSAQAYNVWEYADSIISKPTSDPKTWDWSPALIAAWNATPAGGSLVVPLGVHIASAVTLPDKAVNLYCMGPITVADGNWTALYFDGTANVVEYPGTILTGLTASDTKLNFVSGMEPNLNPTEYYLVIYSNEVNVNRVNEAHYTPYLKRETHSLSHYDWSVHDPILYTYNNLVGVTLRFVKKAQRTKIVGLSLVADTTTDRTARDLLRTCYKSCVDFEGLFIDASKANRAGFGFEMFGCFDFVLNSPRVLGYNLTGFDSYKIRNFLSAHLVFNHYIDATDRDVGGIKTERAYAAMYGNLVLFYNCHLNGIDEHFGSRYIIRGGSLSHRGVGFSGRDFTIDGTRFTGPGVMFQPRDDAPSCSGTLRIDNVELDAVSRLILAETNTTADPLGRTTPFKFFDRVLIDGVVVKGGKQVEDNIISIRGIRSAAKFTSSLTTLFEIKNLKVFSERTTVDQCIVQVANAWIGMLHAKDWEIADSAVAYRGDIRYLGPIYDALNVGELKLTNSRATVYGVRNTAKLTMQGGALAGSGERLLVSGDHGDVTVALSGVDLLKPLSELAPIAGANPTWDIVDCKVAVAPDNLAGRVGRGLRNTIAVGVALPGALVGKLRVYENPSLYIPATILATGSWSVPTIATGGFTSFDFVVSGVVFGDQVDVSIYPFALLVSAQVTGPDTIKVTLYNGTTNAISPGIQGLRFTVRKV
ncbi:MULTISPECIES: hypothetical protein [unclassified Pseudomonas]|uniref:hypothetical protein n=1 Tax=Pseudomonas sp. A-R-26 TaxID=2832404 RepID=UPI001CBDD4DE|nr:hypothetical protein [Pseudomonas sp. A-R-26]